MAQTPPGICQDCHRVLYSHIELSKQIKKPLSKTQRKEFCAVVADIDFCQEPIVCERCCHLILQKSCDGV